MEYVALGKTDLLVSRTAFGAESLACAEIEAFGGEAPERALAIVRRAYSGGMNFFDTSHSKPRAEERLGSALAGIRQNVILATKTAAKSAASVRCDLSESLAALKTDVVDLFQIENPEAVPRKGGADGIYDALAALKAEGAVRHIGLATEDEDIARLAIESGLYETVQFPLSVISPDKIQNLAFLCREREVGCIASQPLNGGVVRDITLALGFFLQYDFAVPVWGIHTQEELDQILYFYDKPPVMDDASKQKMEKLRAFFN